MYTVFKYFSIYLILLTVSGLAIAASPRGKSGPIVVTIKPLYSLVSHLTEGIDKPVLLMKQIQSPHHYNMRPSERRLLADAGMIVWIGPQMESYLEKIIRQQDTVVVSAMQAKGLKLLNRRVKDHSHHTADNLDPHIWLSAHNAIAISHHISQQLISQNPEHRARYSENLQRLTEKITQLSSETSASLKNNTQPFITYHDAFQYFEVENRLNYIDSISFNEDAGVSIKHLQHIKSLIAENNIQCLLYQIPRPDIITALTSKTAVEAVAIDPLGILIEDAQDAWFEIMRDTTLNFKRCLNS